MRPQRRRRAALTAMASAAVLTFALGAPARAATGGWQVVFTHHYGTTTDYTSLTDTVAVSADDAWAFGITGKPGAPPAGTPFALFWNGTTWSRSPLPAGLPNTIGSASAVSASSIWAVTEFGGDILHWNGSQWSIALHIPQSKGLLSSGITALSDSNVWVFGNGGFGPGIGTWHFNGHTWTHLTGKVSWGISAASVVSASDIWALASNARGPAGDKLAHFNGTSWQFVTANALTGLDFNCIVAMSATNVWAASPGVHNREQLVHFNGSTWTTVKSAWPKLALDNAAPDGQGGIWFLGYSGSTTWAVHYSASGQWSRTAITSGFIETLALVPGTTSLWGVGSVATKTAGNARIWSYTPAS